jgi:acyl-CoA thioesterase-1
MVHLLLVLNLPGLAAAAGAPSATAAPCRIAILGDSLAAGYGVALQDAFPARLAAALEARGFACEVLNAGVSGDTSAGGRARLAWVLADAPTHLVVELGGNDALRALPVEQLRGNLAAIVSRAQEAGVEVYLAGMLAPPNLGESYGHEFRAVYHDLAREYDVPLYPFFLDGVITRNEYMQPDGIHPNAEGVLLLVDGVLPSLVQWLQNTGVSRH